MFVIERAETMHDATANRLLKTLEEPAAVRAPDPPHLAAGRGAADRRLALPARALRGAERGAPGGPPGGRGGRRRRRAACGRLALGDGERALALALGDGPALRDAAQAFAVGALRGELEEQPWLALLELAKRAGERTASELEAMHREELEFVARSERARATSASTPSG